MVTVASTTSNATENSSKSIKWMRYSCCSKHMCNNKTDFSDFLECHEVLKHVNNQLILSCLVKTGRVISTVDGVKAVVALQDVIHTFEIMHNLFSI